ncbi:rRNA methyltransferase [Methanofervidicoccus sp. A16]|uniref:TrmJ/YjtD family RNA methyltransferase n=1 Tax=Methanofervidicoccus sp. A16 TaxID=2607662 RepID=UPI00118A2B24|nr:TrmJ/YjtD family RNA methyltransferase [Methanofervidicoccus sp. A16]AXI25454.1 rRNA methyltransferase [Methanofervidicoccus sp. A16]MBW9220276.1 TrmJ/YjtD family RNA methyltransferase [Methanothermococcus sp. SCGC AD-155-N22]
MEPVVILVNPKYSGNVGAIARCMKNFEVKELRIVGNKNILDKEAYIRSVHAKDILDKALFYNSLEDAIEDIDLVVGTSGIVSGDRNLKRVPITPRELAEKHLELKGKIGLVFGREDDGLTNRELDLCDLFLSIPTSPEYPVMNLSHAVAVILYELYISKLEKPFPVKMREASKLEKDTLIKLFEDFVDTNENIPEYRKELCKVIFKRIVSRAFISGKEANTLMCAFRSKKV